MLRLSTVLLDIMEGIQRIYHTGVQYAKARYVPNTMASLLSIGIYTAIVFYLTEFLLRGTLTRWFYLGTLIMVVSMIYTGSVTGSDLIALHRRTQ